MNVISVPSISYPTEARKLHFYLAYFNFLKIVFSFPNMLPICQLMVQAIDFGQ